MPAISGINCNISKQDDTLLVELQVTIRYGRYISSELNRKPAQAANIIHYFGKSIS